MRAFEGNPFAFANIYFYGKEEQGVENTAADAKVVKMIENGQAHYHQERCSLQCTGCYRALTRAYNKERELGCSLSYKDKRQYYYIAFN